MQKKTNIKQPDRIILLEIGVILALLFVNFMLNIQYGAREISSDTEIESGDIWEILSHTETQPEEPQKKELPKQKIQKAIVFDPSALIKQVDDLFKIDEQITKPNIPAGLTFIKPLLIKSSPDTSNRIIDFPDKRPEFPGGEDALRKYIVDNFRIPNIVMETQDKVQMVVEFVINKNGQVSDFKVITNSFPNFQTENAAEQLYKEMPLWVPGSNRGGPVNVRLRQPIKISIH